MVIHKWTCRYWYYKQPYYVCQSFTRCVCPTCSGAGAVTPEESEQLHKCHSESVKQWRKRKRMVCSCLCAIAGLFPAHRPWTLSAPFSKAIPSQRENSLWVCEVLWLADFQYGHRSSLFQPPGGGRTGDWWGLWSGSTTFIASCQQ